MSDDLVKFVTPGEHDYLGEGEQHSVPLVECRGRLEVDDRLGHGKVKTAAAEEAVKAASEVVPEKGKCYLLVIGLGSTEHWGPNNNGDAWPENALLGRPPADVPMSFFDRYAHRLPKTWGYTTFRKAHVFEEHRNKDPRTALGNVLDTFWNPRMHRVENLISFDRTRGRKWAERADRGLNVATSMAARVPYDRCPLCGNLAPTRRQYCGHLRPGSPDYALRQIRPDGVAVVMINDFPDFFDESLVESPAAPEAMLLMKVASENTGRNSKDATIVKKDLDLPADIALDHLVGLYDREPALPGFVLDKLAGLGLGNALAACEQLGMALRPSELLGVVFGPAAKVAALDLDELVVSTPPRPDCDVPGIAKLAQTPLLDTDRTKIALAHGWLEPYAWARSYREPHLSARLLKSGARHPEPAAVSAEQARWLGIYHGLYKAATGSCGYGSLGIALP